MLDDMDDNNFIVDRIEGNVVILEKNNGDIINIDLNCIDRIPADGDVLVKINDSYRVDETATLNRRNHMSKLMRGMWEDE